MATSGSATGRNVIIGFIAGFLAVLVFHQVMSSLLNGRMQWNMGPAAGAAFQKRLPPFVWRRHLDFAAIEDAHAMRLRIREHRGLRGAVT